MDSFRNIVKISVYSQQSNTMKAFYQLPPLSAQPFFGYYFTQRTFFSVYLDTVFQLMVGHNGLIMNASKSLGICPVFHPKLELGSM